MTKKPLVTKKRLFTTDEEQRKALELEYGEMEWDGETDWEARMVEDGFGYISTRDDEYYMYETLEARQSDRGTKLEMWEEIDNDDEGPFNGLIDAAVALYDNGYTETDIMKMVMVAIANKHQGGVH